jgi:hypothetical protein
MKNEDNGIYTGVIKMHQKILQHHDDNVRRLAGKKVKFRIDNAEKTPLGIRIYVEPICYHTSQLVPIIDSFLHFDDPGILQKLLRTL